MDLNLGGKAILITGGSQGIGLETARLFAEEGARVLICGRRMEALDAAAADIRAATGSDVEVASADVSKGDDIDRLVQTAHTRLGRIDVLVNNAGTGTYKPFLDVTDAELLYGMEINFFAQFRMCQKVIPIMLDQGSGVIINVSGETGIMVTPTPFNSACTGPAKAAEIRFSKILATEFGARNIRVNCVVPGLVHTPERFAKWEREMAKSQLNLQEAERVRDEWSSAFGMPNQRWGRPEELANLIVFAASGRSTYVNGAVLVADGGADKS